MTLEDVEDLAVDENFSIHIGPSGDINTVSGREAFEQRVLINIQENIVPALGEFADETIRERVRLGIERVAQQMDMIEEVSSYSAEIEDVTNKLVIEVVYDTGDPLTFEVTE